MGLGLSDASEKLVLLTVLAVLLGAWLFGGLKTDEAVGAYLSRHLRALPSGLCATFRAGGDVEPVKQDALSAAVGADATTESDTFSDL